MLVLSRKKNESVFIGDGRIKVTVVDIRGDKVRMGFEAPPGVSIHREEIYEAIKRGAPDTVTPSALEGEPTWPPRK